MLYQTCQTGVLDTRKPWRSVFISKIKLSRSVIEGGWSLCQSLMVYQISHWSTADAVDVLKKAEVKHRFESAAVIHCMHTDDLSLL